jgi:hypothetical protein
MIVTFLGQGEGVQMTKIGDYCTRINSIIITNIIIMGGEIMSILE